MTPSGPLADLRVCMIVFNDVRHDGRVLKEAQSLRAAGARVQIIGLGTDGADLPKGASLIPPQRRSQASVAPLRGLLSLGYEVEFQQGLAARAAALRADVYHCHDLQTVWAGMRAARGRARVVYDAHELFTERVGIAPWRAALFGLYERRILHQVDLVLAASEPRARIMQRDYGAAARPVTIVNATRLTDAVDVPHPDAQRARAAIDAPHLIMYQGGLHEGRGLSAVIDGLARLPADYALVLMGAGQLQGTLADRIRARGLTGRVHLWSEVAPHEVMAWAAAADAGVVTYRPICRNNIYCAPNKLSEYAAAGLPVLGADLAGLRDFTDRYDLAELFEPGNGRSFAEAARRLLGDPERTRRARAESRRLLSDFHWEQQGARLVQAYQEMLDRPVRRRR